MLRSLSHIINQLRHNVSGTECKWISSADFRRCGTKDVLPKVVIAEAMMNEIRQIAVDHGLAGAKVNSLFSVLDMDLVIFVLDKKHKDRTTVHASMGAAAHDCVVAMRGLAAKTIVSKWELEATVIGDAVKQKTARGKKNDIELLDGMCCFLVY
jgi:hypothetical protein